MPGPTAVVPKSFQVTTAVRQFRWVTQVANETAKEADAVGQRAIGICQEEVSADDATNGRVAAVWLAGSISRAIAGDATPVKGARVTTDAQGRTIIAATGNVVLGIVVSAPTTPAAGDHIDVQIAAALPVV